MKRQTLSKRLPLVSICITSYNYDQFINAAITSALTQSYANIEVVVSDNGSSDATFEKLAEFKNDARVKVYVNDETLTMVANHNAAIKRAKGDYIVMLSADDVLLPHHVATLLARIESSLDPVDMAFGQATYCDINLAPLGSPAAHGILPIDYSHRDEFANMMFIYSHALAANLIPKSVYEHVGYFDEQIEYAFEVDFALRVELAGFRAAVISDVVVAIRSHADATCALRNRDSLTYHQEKMSYIEKFANVEHAWRLEYLGRHVANVLEFERAMIPPDHLDNATAVRSQKLADRLRTFASEHHPWPESRPRVSVVVHTIGATKQLFETLSTLEIQDLSDIEVIVVQTDGLGVQHLVSQLPNANKLRYVKALHLKTAGGALRLGIELARAPYVAYLEEGQSIPQDQLASMVYGIEANNADFVYTDASSIHTTHTMLSSNSAGDMPFIPVQRGEVMPAPGTISFSQMMLRRNLLMGTVLFDSLNDVSEHEFIEAMQFHFQFVSFERRVVSEHVTGAVSRT